MKEKELYRVKEGRWLAGVCAGMAEYMNLTPTVVRWLFVGMALFFGGGILMYLVSIFIIPMEPTPTDSQEEYIDLDNESE